MVGPQAGAKRMNYEEAMKLRPVGPSEHGDLSDACSRNTHRYDVDIQSLDTDIRSKRGSQVESRDHRRD